MTDDPRAAAFEMLLTDEVLTSAGAAYAAAGRSGLYTSNAAMLAAMRAVLVRALCADTILEEHRGANEDWRKL